MKDKSRIEEFMSNCFNRGYPDLPLKKDCQFDKDKFRKLFTTALQEARDEALRDAEKVARNCFKSSRENFYPNLAEAIKRMIEEKQDEG